MTKANKAKIFEYFRVKDIMTWHEIQYIKGAYSYELIEDDDEDASPILSVHIKYDGVDCGLSFEDCGDGTYILLEDEEIDIDDDELFESITWESEANNVTEHSPFRTLIILGLTKEFTDTFPTSELRQIDYMAYEMARNGGTHIIKLPKLGYIRAKMYKGCDPYEAIVIQNWQFDN